MAREVFKIVNNLAPTFIMDLIVLKRSQYDLRNEKTATIPNANSTKYGLNSFAHEGARIWNSLPNAIRIGGDYREFCRLIQNWSGPMCNCIYLIILYNIFISISISIKIGASLGHC